MKHNTIENLSHHLWDNTRPVFPAIDLHALMASQRRIAKEKNPYNIIKNSDHQRLNPDCVRSEEQQGERARGDGDVINDKENAEPPHADTAPTTTEAAVEGKLSPQSQKRRGPS